MKNYVIITFLTCIVLVTIPSILPWSNLEIGNTFIWWLVFGLTLIMIMILKKTYFNINYSKLIWPIKFYLLWNIICIIRGAFVAENYWEWKGLIEKSMFFLLPTIIFVAVNKIMVQKITSFWLKYALPAFFLFVPFFVQSDATGGYLIPIMFLLLFLPVLPKEWKVIVIFFTIAVFLAGLDARSNIIKYSISFILGLLFYFRKFLQKGAIKIAQAALIVLPVVLLVLGITGVFNVFQMNEYINDDTVVSVTMDGEEQEVEMTGDTRTFLYVEVINSAIKNRYIFFGRTPARGYDSEWFGDHTAEDLGTGKRERFASEVSILNIFTWTGLTGVILYFLIFLTSNFTFT